MPCFPVESNRGSCVFAARQPERLRPIQTDEGEAVGKFLYKYKDSCVGPLSDTGSAGPSLITFSINPHEIFLGCVHVLSLPLASAKEELLTRSASSGCQRVCDCRQLPIKSKLFCWLFYLDVALGQYGLVHFCREIG